MSEECLYGDIEFSGGKAIITFPKNFDAEDEREFAEWFMGAFSCWWNCFYFRKHTAAVASGKVKPTLTVVPGKKDD